MRTAIPHLLSNAAGLFLIGLGWHFHLPVVATAGGMYWAFALQGAGHALLDGMRPASRAHRRMARAAESAVRRRSLTMDRDTGAHAA